MSEIVFKINGKVYKADGKTCCLDMSLNDYIRNVALLTGTKYMCQEGGCGACIVSVQAYLPPTFEKKVFAVNSCLVSVLSCQDWEITTVEGLGNKIDGYHTLQTRLASFNGTQCGYCSPGWIMSMYSEHEAHPEMTAEEIEHSFAGNLCRCTGYRPIADAWKTFAVDPDDDLTRKMVDVEDLGLVKPCGVKCNNKCAHKKRLDDNDDHSDSDDWCILNEVNNKMIVIDCGSYKWFKVYNLDEAFTAMTYGDYRVIAGNTGKGVYPEINDCTVVCKNVIDIFNISQLKEHTIDVNLILGAGMTLIDMMSLFLKLSQENLNFSYLKEFHDHMTLVAHNAVKNIGTIGGNLSLKHLHPEFPSDLFLMFETVGAIITVGWRNIKNKLTLPQYLKTNMKGWLILNVILPPLSNRYCSLKTYKIMSRAQNTHAIVNAGFLFEFDSKSGRIKKARIVYGNISKSFVHASKTERVLVGRDPYNDATLQLALRTLNGEVNAVELPPEPSADFRKSLALALYYKVTLASCPKDRVDPKYRSGGEVLRRITSKGTQVYDTDKSLWPLNQPIPKLEGLVQCSGEATFANDLPRHKHEIYCAFVTADVPPGSIIESFDMTEASKIPGVITLYTAKDIPGQNSITPAKIPIVIAQEEFLCSKVVLFYGQAAAVLVANKEKTAAKAAKLVKINYASVATKKPLLTIPEVLKSSESKQRIHLDKTVNPTETGENVEKVITGEFSIGPQFHFTMEPQTCVVIPTEVGMDVYCATQWMDYAQIAIANCLNIFANKVNVIVKQVGGAYGSKISRPAYLACAAAMVAHKQGKPTRIIVPLKTNMKIMGKRPPFYSTFEVGVNKEGQIQYLKIKMYSDSGCSFNENMTVVMIEHFKSCYDFKRWYIEAYSVLTDTHSNTYCRAPFSTEGVAMIEYIMEKIAFELKIDPLGVRYKNFSTDQNIPVMLEQLLKDSTYDNRRAEIRTFNRNNRWRKRGIKLVPMAYVLNQFRTYNALVSIFHGDGSVAVTHGGIEMGQGINTKAAQVCAHILGVPLDLISIKPSHTTTSPNCFVTGGSVGSESIAYATMKASEILVERLKPIKEKMGSASWKEVIQQAYLENVNLQATYCLQDTQEPRNYTIYGACVLEVEIDVLTGNHNIRRLDILQDTGRSLSPEIDVGQIEGATVMGLGYYTSEELVYNTSTGELLTNNTWTYKVPGMKDIPEVFKITFRRNGSNELGVLESKATGEPPQCMTSVILHALTEAVRSARRDAGYSDNHFDIGHPCTVERIFKAIGHKIEHYKLKN